LDPSRARCRLPRGPAGQRWRVRTPASDVPTVSTRWPFFLWSSISRRARTKRSTPVTGRKKGMKTRGKPGREGDKCEVAGVESHRREPTVSIWSPGPMGKQGIVLHLVSIFSISPLPHLSPSALRSLGRSPQFANIRLEKRPGPIVDCAACRGGFVHRGGGGGTRKAPAPNSGFLLASRIFCLVVNFAGRWPWLLRGAPWGEDPHEPHSAAVHPLTGLGAWACRRRPHSPTTPGARGLGFPPQRAIMATCRRLSLTLGT
jgi:hypothetical protein